MQIDSDITRRVFLRDASTYIRDVDPIEHYRHQMARLAEIEHGISHDEAVALVDKIMRASTKTKNPSVVVYHRDMDTEDKEKIRMPLTEFLSSIITNNDIMVPSGTCYVQPTVKVSLLAESINKNATLRGVVKKASAVAFAEKRLDDYERLEGEQTNIKLDNNVYSGLFNANGNTLYNPSAHSSLTSTTRTITSIGNANNERMISGNRHYRSYDIVMNNLLFTVDSLEREQGGVKVKDLLLSVMLKYGIAYPTPEQVMAEILRSTRFYWRHPTLEDSIYGIISKLTPLQLAGFLYIGDMYQLRQYNDALMRGFFKGLTEKVSGVTEGIDFTVLSRGDEEVLNYLHKIFMDEMGGKGKKYTDINTKTPELMAGLYYTYINIQETLLRYKDLIDVFFKTINIPPSVAAMPDMLRRSGVMGDTDSSATAGGKWAEWWCGKMVFTDESRRVANAALFVSSQTMRHLLAVCSGHMGIGEAMKFKLSMKPEFYWDTFAATDVSKTYYARKDVREGAVYEEPELETKGVNLKNSNAPMRIRDMSKVMMMDYLKAASGNKQLNMRAELERVADLERLIEESLSGGNMEFYRKLNIKGEKGYKQEAAKSNYRYYTFWKEIFGGKYTNLPEPPYTSIKVNTTLMNKTAIKKWIASIEDRRIAEKLETFFSRTGRSNLKTVYVPIDHINLYGMPPEIVSIINYSKITMDLVNMCYIVLSSLSYQKKPGYRLIDLGY